MSARNYLPSKKFIILIIIALLIIVFFLVKDKLFKKDTKTYTAQQQLFLNTEISDFAILDSDGDGLYDWEEALWGTDPEKKDTHGTGIGDKEYVNNIKKELGLTTMEKSDISITETDRISMEFFTIISSLEQKGLLDKDSIKNLGEVFGNEISKPIIIDDESITSDFKIIAETSQSYIAYKQKMLEILEKARVNNLGREIEYFAKYISDPTNKNLEALNLIAKAYDDFSSSLQDVLVPETISTVHTNLFIDSKKISLAIGLLSQYDEDPVLATKGFTLYKESSGKFEDSIYSLSSYFQKIDN